MKTLKHIQHAAIVLFFGIVVAAQDNSHHPPTSDSPIPKRWLPVDEAGWTVFTPANDTRIIYVSSSVGDDATAAVYGREDPAVRADPFHPTGPVKACRSLAKAVSLLRDGHPDWILLRRGDTWREPLGHIPSGRDAANPLLLGAYGDADSRPVFEIPKGVVYAVDLRNGSRHDVAIVGLDFHFVLRDPNHPEFVGVKDAGGGCAVGLLTQKRKNNKIERILVEDCRTRYASYAIKLEAAKEADGMASDLALRRNLILDSYGVKKSQGLWATLAHRVLIEENIFDHNGWLTQREKGSPHRPGDAFVLNHNSYVHKLKGAVYRGNIFCRSSSINIKHAANEFRHASHSIVIDDNLILGSEIGISMGRSVGPLRWRDVRVTDNVFAHIGMDRPTNRNLGWCLKMDDWDGGLVAGNLMVHQDTEGVSDVYAIRFSTPSSPPGGFGGRFTGLRGHARDVSIRDNVIYGMQSDSPLIQIKNVNVMENIEIRNNQVQVPGHPVRLVSMEGEDLSGVRLSGNTYWSGAPRSHWFSYRGKPLDFAEWTRASGETDAKMEEVAYHDPSRDLPVYLKHLGFEASFDSFYAEIRKQSKTNWRPEFTAAAINDWMRAGFGMQRTEKKP